MGISVRINAQEVVSHTFKRTLFQDLEGEDMVFPIIRCHISLWCMFNFF